MDKLYGRLQRAQVAARRINYKVRPGLSVEEIGMLLHALEKTYSLPEKSDG